MNNLEKKSTCNLCHKEFIYNSEIDYDWCLCPICRKEPKDMIIENLFNENTALKKKFDNQKYLDRDEIEKKILGMLKDIKCDWQRGENGEFIYNTITAICSLAIPENKQTEAMKDIIKSLEHDVKFWKDKSMGIAIKPITKDRIIEVMKKYMCELSGDVPIAYANKIATEILDISGMTDEEKDMNTYTATEILEGKEKPNDK